MHSPNECNFKHDWRGSFSGMFFSAGGHLLHAGGEEGVLSIQYAHVVCPRVRDDRDVQEVFRMIDRLTAEDRCAALSVGTVYVSTVCVRCAGAAQYMYRSSPDSSMISPSWGILTRRYRESRSMRTCMGKAHTRETGDCGGGELEQPPPPTHTPTHPPTHPPHPPTAP
jgi:hypothetical protein